MEYKPGGYSWLGVAPETEAEQHVEALEEQIYFLHKEFKKSGNEKLLQEIQQLENKISRIKSISSK